ncbi:MAG: hypothetical protein QXZ44_02540, partial [Ferroplasma sp.]
NLIIDSYVLIFMNDKYQKKKKIREFRKEASLFLRYVLGIHIYSKPKIKVKLNDNYNTKYGAATSITKIKKGSVKTQKIEIYGNDNLNQSTIIHEYMHALRFKKFKIHTGKSYLILSRLIPSNHRKYRIVSVLLNNGIQEALAILTEIAYNYYSYFSPECNIDNLFLDYIARIGIDREECYLIFMKILNMKSYNKASFYSQNESINKTYGSEYNYNWLFGLYIGYGILGLNHMDIGKSIDILYRYTDNAISKLLVENSDKLPAILNPITGSRP